MGEQPVNRYILLADFPNVDRVRMYSVAFLFSFGIIGMFLMDTVMYAIYMTLLTVASYIPVRDAKRKRDEFTRGITQRILKHYDTLGCQAVANDMKRIEQIANKYSQKQFTHHETLVSLVGESGDVMYSLVDFNNTTKEISIIVG